MAEEAKINFTIDGAPAAKTLGELETKAEQLTEQLKNAKLGTKAYDDLKLQLIETTREVKNLELGFEALDNEQVASEIGSVAGAIGDVTASMILLGGENETLEEMAANIEMALGVSMAVKGAIEGISSAQKLWNDAITKYTFLQKTVNVLTKAFAKITKTALGTLGLLITLVAGAAAIISKMGGAISSAEKAQKALNKAMGEANAEVSKLESKLLSYSTVLTDVTANEEDRGRALQKINELLPKGTEAITEQNIANGEYIEIIKEQIGLIRERAELTAFENILTQNTTDLLTHQMELRKLERDGSDLDIATKKAQILDLEAQNRIILEQIQLRQKNVLAMDEESTEGLATQTRNNAQVEKLDREKTDKEISNAKEVEDVKEEIDTREADRKAELILEIEALENAQLEKTLTNQQKEENAVREKYFALIEEAKQFNLDTAELERLQQEELLKIRIEFAQEEARVIQEIRDEFAEQERLKKEEQNKKLEEEDARNKAVLKQGAQDLFNAANKLSKFLFDKDMKRAQEKADRGESLTKQEIKRLKTQDKIQKAFALAQIASDTARGISAAIAAGAGVPFPFNLGAIASGVAAVISGAVQAASVLGEAVEIPSPSDIGGGGSNSETSDQNIPNLEAAQFGSTLLNDQKVVVLESDITEVQNNVQVIESQATFG